MHWLGIPSFDRDRPQWWVRQCERAFYRHHIDEVIKVHVAATYLEGVSYVWFQNWSWGRVRLSWPQFVIDLCNRFGKRTNTNIINGASKAVSLEVQEADEEEKEAEEGIEEMGDGSPLAHEAGKGAVEEEEVSEEEDLENDSISSNPADAGIFPAFDSQKQQEIEEEDLENGSPSSTPIDAEIFHAREIVAAKVEEEKVAEEEMEEGELEDGIPLVGNLSSTTNGAETLEAVNKKKEIQDKKKKRRRRNQWVKMGIG